MSDKDKKQTADNSEEVEKYKKQAEEYLNNWKRERADFINYKKEEARRVEEIIKFANEGVILEILDLVDDLEIARQNFTEQNLSGQAAKETKNHGIGPVRNSPPNGPPDRASAGEISYGIDQILKKFEELLKKYGIERIKIEGPFNPELHEAVETEPEGTKLEEVRAGYTMYGKVIRSARVKIIK